MIFKYLAFALLPILYAEVYSATNEYVVMLRDEIDMQDHFASLGSYMNVADENGVVSKVMHIYDNLPAYYAVLGRNVAQMLQHSTDVAIFEENKIYTALDEQLHPPSWGLARISQRGEKYNDVYIYGNKAGENVDVYVIDTGINIKHKDFEGRAIWGLTAPSGDDDQDGQGHGTHVSGTIAGKTYGVAKKATLIAVKVLKKDGSGNLFDVLKGIDWVGSQKQKTGRRSVANMSLGGGKSSILNLFVDMAISKGVHFAVAAGNSDQDACDFSPASSTKAITVGATNATNERAFFSNWGKCVNVFAPGFYIKSAWKDSATDEKVISGTSMASPHVAGVLALFASVKDSTPEEMMKRIESVASKNVLSNLNVDSPNLLLFNGGNDLGNNEEPDFGFRFRMSAYKA